MTRQHKIHILTYHAAGFFSNFLAVLAKLRECEKAEATPVVFWGKYCYDNKSCQNPYWEEKYGKNVWEYYFEPVSNYRLNDIENNLHADNMEFIETPKLFTRKSCESIRKTAHFYIKKYIKIRLHIMEKVEKYYDCHMKNHHVLGVHMRGTDRCMDEFVQQCSPLPSAYIKQIDKYLKIHSKAIIFVATDSNVLLNAIRERYPDRVIYYNSIRSETNIDSVHWTTVGSPYQKGEDVLIECMLLSKCDFLIRSISNVSTASLYFNPELKQINIAQLYYNNQMESFIDQVYLDWADKILGVRGVILWNIRRMVNELKKIINKK
ncbi:MAG: O-fucosyltransferase family protein [Candidatus Omnitrophota bacterium]|nr:MAG: O-fucosyltransferase family protein [Candidatus Omnitrophota bacterium]